MIDGPNQNGSQARPNVLLGNAKDYQHLVFHRNNATDGETIVYVDKVCDLEWECDDQAETTLKDIREGLGRIQNGIASLEPIAHNWPPDLKLSTKRVLGEAIARVLQRDVAGADAALLHAKQFVKNKSQQVSRYWTLQACLAAGGIALVSGVIEIGLRQWFEIALKHVPYLLSLCFWSGCVGALLFVILKIGGERKVDSTAEQRLHYIEGISRIVAGGLSGVFVGSMIKLGLVLSIFTQTGMEALAMCAGAMIAGASERFAAGIITSVEVNNLNKQEDKNATN
jgi:hypothetical protein